MPLRGPGQGTLITSPLGSSIAGFSASVSVKKWFTTIREVSDLYFGIVGSSNIQNEETLMLGNRENYLKNGNIRVDSESVKRVNTVVPPDEITFSSCNTWKNLSNSDIVKGSVRVFDSGETSGFQEGVDFEINYTDGKIRRLQVKGTPGDASSSGAGAGSSISEFAGVLEVEQKVKVFYEYYSTYVKGTDYQINYSFGTLSRLSSGSIRNGERVAVDYQVISNIGEQIIEDVINQAHKYIMNRISAELEGTENEDLKYAETYFALGLLAQSSASDMLEAKRNNNVSNAAETMLKLAAGYEEKAWEFLSPYLSTGLIRTSGAKIVKNLS
nr:hypothetical protein 6 [bacterium]